MSNSTTKATSKGIRYTPEQKKEVVDFAVSYNAANGRGGQSQAAEKFNISQITVAAWLKAAGATSKGAKKVKAPKAAKAPKAVKTAKAAKAPKAAKEGDTKQGTRYTDEQKQEVTDFVVAYNAANGGRGGPSNAAKKFNVSVLTVGAWLKRAGLKDSKKSGKPSKAKAAPATKVRAAAPAAASTSGGFDAKLGALLTLSKQIASAEAELVSMQAKFKALKAAL